MMIEAIIAGAGLGIVHQMGRAGVIPNYGKRDIGAGARFWLFWMFTLGAANMASPDDITGGLIAAAALWGGFLAATVTGEAVRAAMGG